MEKLIARLQKIDALIEESKKRQTRTKVSSYYTEFAGEEQREKDIQNLKRIEARLLKYRSAILGSLTIRINLAQYDISNRLREINTNQ